MKTLFKSIILLLVLFLGVACEDEETNEFGAIGDIEIIVDGNLKSAPTTISFSAAAENAAFFIWDFDYSKKVYNEDKLAMGAEGNEVELTIEEKGVYIAKVIAYNGNNDTKTETIEIKVFSAEEDIDIQTSSDINLDLERNLCTPDPNIQFDIRFEILDPNSIVDFAYVVRSYFSESIGEVEITDTLETNIQEYQFTGQTELLASFDVDKTLIDNGDVLAYKVYVIADNGETYLLDELIETASVELSEPVLIPTGKWLASNNTTGFTKMVELKRPSPFYAEDDGRYWISDFGLDWSNWYDYWYTVEFKLKCPEGDNTDYIIDLFGNGLDSSNEQTGINRFGEEETKAIRVMPYIYSSSVVGYYNPETYTITFKDVPLTDAWWAADNHTVDLTFKYVQE